MRIIGFQEFAAMPEGTVYYKYQPQVFVDLGIKEQSYRGTVYSQGKPIREGYTDFLVTNVDFPWVKGSNGEWDDDCILSKAEETGSSFEVEFNVTSRDALYEQDQLYAVFEKADLEAYIAVFSDALARGYR